MTASEQLLSAFSQVYFFEELVQDNLQYIDEDGNTKELADLVLNMGDTIIAIQLKERDNTARTSNAELEKRWFDNKIRVAKKQLKNTVDYIRQGQIPAFRNKRGVEIPVHSDAEVIPLVVFMNEAITYYPHILEKHSADGLTVNCLSLSDFQTMCKKLISPAEIIDYLKYRCAFFEQYGPIKYIISDVSETDLIITRPTSNEALVNQFLIEKYGADELKKNNNQFDRFRWFLQQTAERSTVGRDDYATYTILLFLAHFQRNEIRAFWERIILARDQASNQDFGIVGSLRREKTYAIFFVSSKPEHALPMEYLLELARKVDDPTIILQVYVWWEDDENYRIDYLLWDRNTATRI